MLEKNRQKNTELQAQRESVRTHVAPSIASAYTLGSASMYRSIQPDTSRVHMDSEEAPAGSDGSQEISNSQMFEMRQ